MHSHSVALIHQRLAQDDTQAVDKRLNTILQSACELLTLDVAIISNVNRTGKTYTLAHTFSRTITLPVGKIFPLKVNFCALAVHRNAPVMIHNMALLSKFRHPCHNYFTLEAYIGIPIQVNGKTFGTLNFCGTTPHAPFTDTDYALMLNLAVIVGDLMTLKAKNCAENARETQVAPIIVTV